MARKLNIAVLVVIALAAILQGSTAVTTYVVGDALGWTVPPGGPIAYSTWATNKTFTVGDTLVFNFTTGAHDVARVTKAAFDSCNGTSTISTATTGPTNITLSAAGEYYFICTFGSHCTLGQKLAINVTAAGPSPAPEPSTPSPASAPTPTASRAPMTYEVGDSLGWNVPPGGPIAYQTWAFNKTFMVGDTLVFNFTNGVHNVAEVAKAAYDSCNTTTTISLTTTSPARITLTTPGTHYYTCTFPNHCTLGQKLAINVTGSAATPPTSAATPPTSAATPPSSSATPPSTSTTPTTPSSPAPTGSDVVPPPPASSAPSFSAAAAGLSTVVLSIAVALLY